MGREKFKEVVWVGSSRRDLIKLGEDMCDAFGTDLLDVQKGTDPKSVKHLRNGLSEIKVNEDGGSTYRLMYIAKFEEAVYVLHVFQKKSHKDSETPKRDADLITARYADALEQHNRYLEGQKESQNE